ncbi:tRNA (uracil-5-)-methyltransferase homolog A [Lepeophtheirus salmonis]|uniref:tRNA (uracil-5-)-methyltransferase homolog A n=1 Tax=Lepeophtheirus salmonis TaxID=72036 RepID=UPI001AEABE79|nr:tRNA (uracil-5-)-methyltransferase homolog A-like [Lepeophtheirus salmonis]
MSTADVEMSIDAIEAHNLSKDDMSVDSIEAQNLLKDEKSVDAMEVQNLSKNEKPMIPEEALVESRSFFTSEIYKIEVQGLPKFFGVGDAKKFFNKKHCLNVHKFKYAGKKASYMFLNFKNEDDRERAIAVVDGLELKGKKLKAFKSKPAKDPLVRIKQKQALEELKIDNRPIKERILSAVCPLYEMPYDEQIKHKTEIVTDFIKKFHGDLIKANHNIKKMVDDKTLELPTLEEFIKSPIINGYRNKCEFTIGLHPKDRTKVQVGFRLSSYKEGNTSVVNAEDVPFVPEPMKKLTKFFEELVTNSGYSTYDPISLSGHWKILLLRINSQKEVLMKITFNPQLLEDKELETIKDYIKQKISHYMEQNHDFKIVSTFLRFESRTSKASSQLLLGENGFHESLGNLRFKVSPESFFQVNTSAAELLYTKVGELADLHPDTTDLIDVCCGTGTIGLFLSNKCRKVYGVEIVPEAVKDAIKNANTNNITNVDFRAGKAEYLLGSIFKDVKQENKDIDSTSTKVVAIVDPPRSGLHQNAVRTLRASEVETLVYISCDMSAAMQNMVNLGKPESNFYVGNPFIPKRIIAVDLFPHTSKHFEVVVLFQRLKSNDDS